MSTKVSGLARSRRRPAIGPLRILAAVAAPLVLISAAPIAPSATAAASAARQPSARPATVAVVDGAPRPAPAPAQVTIPSLRAASYTVTLITGDRLRLTATAAGKYSITLAGSSVYSPAVRVTAQADAKGVTSLYALPTTAAALISGGLVDKDMFDLSWLASHGDTGPGSRLQVDLRYSGQLDASSMSHAAAALPGVTVNSVSASDSTVQVSLDTRRAMAFWAALTGWNPVSAQASTFQSAPSLAGGVARLWLVGHQAAPAAQPRSQAGQGVYTVTETIHSTSDPADWCAPQMALCLSAANFSLTGVAGAGAGNFYQAADLTCVNTNPCTTYQVIFSVPAGVYMAAGMAEFEIGPRLQFMDLVDPQFTVADDTRIDLDASTARQVSISTPQPSDSAAAAFQDYRTLPGGGFSTDFTFVGYGYQNLWVTASTQPVNIGTYHYSSAWTLGAPPVTMTADAPGHIVLDPTYPSFTNLTLPFTRFSGRRTMPLAYVGYGRPSDFTGVDVHGKLVLMRVDPEIGCAVTQSQLSSALQAGAAGVLIDPRNADTRSGTCLLPVLPLWLLNVGTSVNIPFVAIPGTQATALEDLLTAGPVRITVADSGTSPYLYDLKFYQESRVPSDLHYTVTDRQLAEVTARFDSAQPDVADASDTVFGPDDYLGAGVSYTWPTAYSGREYIGPVAPDSVHQRLTLTSTDQSQALAEDVFSQGGSTRTEDWFGQPTAPGAVTAPTDVFAAQPGKWLNPASFTTLCAFCRQGDVFYPFFYPVSGASPRLSPGTAMAFDPGSIHLYQGTQELPQTLLLGQYVTYQLPTQPTAYRLTTADGDTYTDWQFTSSRPASDATPDGYLCIGTVLGDSAPCHADPLIFLRYNAFTGLSDAVTASSAHRLQITAYYQASDPATSVNSVQLWISTDGGDTWQRAEPQGRDGSFTAVYQVPALSATSGTVSIRAQATDSAGNSVTQTIYNAYNLTAAG